MYKDDRPPVVVEIDDETDADMIAALHDWSTPIGIDMVNIGVTSSLLYLNSRLLLFLPCCHTLPQLHCLSPFSPLSTPYPSNVFAFVIHHLPQFVPGSGVRPMGEGRTVTVLLRKKMSQAAKHYRQKAAESSRNSSMLPALTMAGILSTLFKVRECTRLLRSLFLSCTIYVATPLPSLDDLFRFLS